MKYFLLLISIIILSTGCAATIKTTSIIPANSSEITEYKNVAILNFNGNIGYDITSRIESVLQNAEVRDKKQYNVINRKDIDTILNEQQFQMSMSNPDTAVEFGQLIGAEAIWTGNAERNFNNLISYEPRTRCGYYKDGKCTGYITVSVRCELHEINVVIIPKLTSVATGKIVFTKEFKQNVSSYSCIDNSIGWVSENELYEKAVKSIVQDFRKEIAPYEKNISLELMNDKEGTNSQSLELLKNGIEFAKNGRVEKACQLWRDGIKKSPDAVGLNYNIGICLEIENNYEEAIKQYMKAEDLYGKPSKLISAAIERNKENIKNQKKLKKQL